MILQTILKNEILKSLETNNFKRAINLNGRYLDSIERLENISEEEFENLISTPYDLFCNKAIRTVKPNSQDKLNLLCCAYDLVMKGSKKYRQN